MRRPALAAIVLLCPAVAMAQTLFQWPDQSPDVARYSTVEDCVAAIRRIRVSREHREARTAWRDTMPPDPLAQLRPAPTEVTETATRCAAQFAEPSVDLIAYRSFLNLLLAAGRDSDALALLGRRLAAVAANNPRERQLVIDSAVHIYLDAQPMRLAASEALIARYTRDGASRVARLAVCDYLRQWSHAVGDTARARRVARWITGIGDSLTPAERQSPEYTELALGMGGDVLILGAMEERAGFPVLLDSLRHSTAALAALEFDMIRKASGGRPDLLLPFGRPAPRLAADFWAPSDAGQGSRPTHGRVSFFDFLAFSDCLGSEGSHYVGACERRIAMLRRLARRFPDLEVVIVASTSGSFMYAPPMSPAAEATLIGQWMNAHHVPNAVLAIDTTPFYRLPAPDDRRINRTVPYIALWGYGVWHPEREGGNALIDTDGVIADVMPGRSEEEWAQEIDVLLHRPHPGS